MTDVIDYIFKLRDQGHIISFELNKFGFFSVVEHYNEKANGRTIYGAKKNVLWNGFYADIDSASVCAAIDANMKDKSEH
jgi:hypothetical protein